VRRDLVIAVTDGDLLAEISAVDQSLQEHCEALDPMDVGGEKAEIRPIEFWLDLPGIPGWKSLAHVEDQVCFVLNETTALVRARAG
jgi:hypothetical protein